MKVLQNNFNDGFDLLSCDTEISKNGFLYLINARQRLGFIEPNKKPLEITGAPAGKKQGGIALEDVLIAFIAGSAWYNVDGSDSWIQIPGFAMSPTVDIYYAIAVPDGTVKYQRKLETANISNPISREYPDFLIDGTPAGILVQDGINQPYLIQQLASGIFSARVTNTYAKWKNEQKNREYVPIGKQMTIVDAKLLISSPDNKKIYQSISGRYLDFMVNVDVNGDKLPTEAQGGADSVSFNFDSADITCLTECNIPSSFIYGTSRNLRIVTLDYNNTIFGEPTYFVSEKLTVGVVNQDSIIDILGDYAIIDFEGIKSFNAVKNLKIEGDNSIFSLNIGRIIKKIKQTNPHAIMYDNFALFYLKTKWGNLIAVFDTLLQRWSSFDIIDALLIKKFAITTTTSAFHLYAFTGDDKIYKLYSSTEVETAQLHTRSYTRHNAEDAPDSFSNIKGESFKLAFADGSIEGTVQLVEQADGQKSLSLSKTLPIDVSGISFPISFPIIFNANQTDEAITFNLRGGKKGSKLSYIIKWNSDAILNSIELVTSEEVPAVAKKQKERISSETYK